MTLLNAAYFLLFVCNFVCLLFVIVLLYRVLETSEKSFGNINSATTKLLEIVVLQKKASTNIAEAASRMQSEVSQLEALIEKRFAALFSALKSFASQIAERIFAESKAQFAAKSNKTDSDLPSQSVQNELNSLVSRCHSLQSELDQVNYRFRTLTEENAELRERAQDQHANRRRETEQLSTRLAELERELLSATNNARSSQARAEENANIIADLREEVEHYKANQTKFFDQVDNLQQVDVIALTERIDFLSSREKSLSERIAEYDAAFERMQIEKNFIEDRYLQLDAGEDASSATKKPSR